jgi:hypothetical protein
MQLSPPPLLTVLHSRAQGSTGEHSKNLGLWSLCQGVLN